MTKYYVLYVWGDIEPKIFGPYPARYMRDRKALSLHRDDPDSGVYWLNDDDGIEVGSYSFAFFEDDLSE